MIAAVEPTVGKANQRQRRAGALGRLTSIESPKKPVRLIDQRRSGRRAEEAYLPPSVSSPTRGEYIGVKVRPANQGRPADVKR
jgi:hypothetical protein